MIVRVLEDAQYRLDDAAFASVSAIDDRVQAAADAGDDTAFAAALGELVAAIRAAGEPVPADEFIGSDAVVPHPDTTLEEAKEMLSEEGLVPNEPGGSA
jgi:hypothetical protein